MKKFTEYIKSHHSGLAFWIFAVVSIALLVAGFCLPPKGEIDNSVLTAVGELFAFAALAVVPSAIKEGRSVKVKYNDAELEVSGKDGEQV